MSSPRWRCRLKLGQTAGSFGIHPALLDAALHAGVLAQAGAGEGPGAEAGTVRLPFAWTGVSVYAPGASALRVRLRPEAAGLALVAADETGAPVVSVAGLVSRPVPAGQLEAAGNGLADALFTVEWVPVPASAGTDAAARDVILTCDTPAAGAACAARRRSGPGSAGCWAWCRNGWPGTRRPGSAWSW